MIILDTHVWLWLVADPGRLSVAAREAISREDLIGIAAISLWEISMLDQRGRITLAIPRLQWFELCLSAPGFRLLPLTPAIADKTVSLDMHADPADRLIAATALIHNCSLVTADQKIIASGVVNTTW